MIWKLLAIAISGFCFIASAQAFQIGEYFDFNPIANRPNPTACETRMNQAIARVEVRPDITPYGQWGVCGTSIKNSFSGRGNNSGTGFLVSTDPPILLTNQHNLRTALDLNLVRNSLQNNTNPCDSGNFRFNFTSLGQSVGCKRILYSFPNPNMTQNLPAALRADAVFIELDRLPDNAQPLELSRGNRAPTQVTLAGHPFASDTLGMTRCEHQSPTHSCDSAAGSSGSPIIDTSSCEVIGIHSAGLTDNGRCQSAPAIDHENTCVTYPANPETCRNLYSPSENLVNALDLIENDQITIKDENAPFDSIDRYTIRSETSPGAPLADPAATTPANL